MNITENDVKGIICDIRKDFDMAVVNATEFDFEVKKAKARYQMQGVLKVVTPYKIASFVLVELGYLKAAQWVKANVV